MRSAALCALALAVLLAARPASADGQTIEVYKSESCGCCGLWIDHLRKSGFAAVARNTALGELARIKAAAGLKPPLQSCHTAKVGGYVVEGHVPAEDVKRLLAERPDAIGLTVPGMPIGSPGMEAGDTREPYEVLLVKKDGSTDVFSRH